MLRTSSAVALRSDCKEASSRFDEFCGSFARGESEPGMSAAAGSGGSDEEKDTTEGHLAGGDDLNAVEDVCLVGQAGRGTIGSTRHVEVTVVGCRAAELLPRLQTPGFNRVHEMGIIANQGERRVRKD